MQEGWIESNPAEQTRKFVHTRQRERLTIAAYMAIHAHAQSWLQNAMDLSLITLLRREDVAGLRFADVHDDALWVVPQKTEGSTALRLRSQGRAGIGPSRGALPRRRRVSLPSAPAAGEGPPAREAGRRARAPHPGPAGADHPHLRRGARRGRHRG